MALGGFNVEAEEEAEVAQDPGDDRVDNPAADGDDKSADDLAQEGVDQELDGVDLAFAEAAAAAAAPLSLSMAASSFLAASPARPRSSVMSDMSMYSSTVPSTPCLSSAVQVAPPSEISEHHAPTSAVLICLAAATASTQALVMILIIVMSYLRIIVSYSGCTSTSTSRTVLVKRLLGLLRTSRPWGPQYARMAACNRRPYNRTHRRNSCCCHRAAAKTTLASTRARGARRTRRRCASCCSWELTAALSLAPNTYAAASPQAVLLRVHQRPARPAPLSTACCCCCS